MTIKRPILTIALASFIMSLSLLFGIINNKNIQANFFGKPVANIMQGLILPNLTRIQNDTVEIVDTLNNAIGETIISVKEGNWTYCEYEKPENPEYAVEFKSIDIEEAVTAGGIFTVSFNFVNTGNVRIFANGTSCEGSVLNLGTQYEQDRASIFGATNTAISGWKGQNRVKMLEPYADPNEEFVISFQSLAPEGDNIYKEFFQAVFEGRGWTGEIIPLTLRFGAPTTEMEDDMSFVNHLSIDAQKLTGLERNLVISIKEQKLYAKFGDYAVWNMQTSTGASKTPTPTGSYKIFQKQELRVGGQAPHYRMPYWQFWDARGYGIHALPYLGSNQGGYFWEEAREHIGIPVSHGCVRTLPEDAEKLYYFTEIGTPLVIRY